MMSWASTAAMSANHPGALHLTWKFMLMGGRAQGLRSLVVDTRVTSARRLCSAWPLNRFTFHTCRGTLSCWSVPTPICATPGCAAMLWDHCGSSVFVPAPIISPPYSFCLRQSCACCSLFHCYLSTRSSIPTRPRVTHPTRPPTTQTLPPVLFPHLTSALRMGSYLALPALTLMLALAVYSGTGTRMTQLMANSLEP